MCHGIAPGFVLRDQIAEELLEQVKEEAESDVPTDGTPSFASEDEPAGEAITGGATGGSERPTGGPK